MPRDLERLLENKYNFVPAEGHSSKHRWYELKLDGLPPILTQVSHDRDEIRSTLEGLIAKQLRVRKPYFRGMVSCHNDRENYYQQVRNDPFPPWEIKF
jgi:hypothetical protein